MTATKLNNLEKAINSSLTTGVKSSTIRFNQLTIEVEIEDINKTILFLKTNEKCKFRQLIDITAVDYPKKEKADWDALQAQKNWNSSYPFAVDNVEEFAHFCMESGGFTIC